MAPYTLFQVYLHTESRIRDPNRTDFSDNDYPHGVYNDIESAMANVKERLAARGPEIPDSRVVSKWFVREWLPTTRPGETMYYKDHFLPE